MQRHVFAFDGSPQGLIRRVHEYPVCVSESPPTASRHLGGVAGAVTGAAGVDDDDFRVVRLCDGRRTVDEICCELAMSYAEVVQAIQRRPNYVIVKK